MKNQVSKRWQRWVDRRLPRSDVQTFSQKNIFILPTGAGVVFGILLWGRHFRGWRGSNAIRWTLAGFLLLMLAYFGSKLVREFLLAA